MKTSLSTIFDDLNLSSIGDPLSSGSFFFEKGSAKDFHYKNLSAGEKSVFDLILDMIIKSTFYSDAVFCLDEPEAHMHTRLQAKVLTELYSLNTANSQLWISTHSIGMLKQAEIIEQANPGTVVFLDFANRDFDLTEVMKPAQIDRAIWDRFFDLAFADFSQLIADMLAKHDISGDCLELEITERLLMKDVPEVVAALNSFKEMNIRLSIDDFGTGYSSLSYLKRFPFDVVKIDQSFVRDIGKDPDDTALCEAIIAMAHSLGLSLIAEGVETKEQFEFLRERGTETLQGYYMGKPAAFSEFRKVLGQKVD